jgi:hypothetical protein
MILPTCNDIRLGRLSSRAALQRVADLVIHEKKLIAALLSEPGTTHLLYSTRACSTQARGVPGGYTLSTALRSNRPWREGRRSKRQRTAGRHAWRKQREGEVSVAGFPGENTKFLAV